MEFIKSALLSFQNGHDIIRIDCGPAYYIGTIDIKTIPEDFSENYKEIIQKSFIGYKDESFNITGSFEHEDYSMNNRYNIKISFKNKFYSFDKQICIPLIINQKDKVDYLDEKVRYLEASVKTLMELNKTQIEIEQDSESDSESDKDSVDSEDKEEVQTKVKNIIIGKKVIQNSKSQVKKL
jgi:hypothetical protein